MFRSPIAIVVSTLLFASPAPALAHAFPTTTNPAVGSTLKTAPTEVVINFTEELEPRFSSIEVLNAAGSRVDKNDAHLAPNDAKRFIVDLSQLPPGTYKVVWHATSIDTHKTQGSFTFTVAP